MSVHDQNHWALWRLYGSRALKFDRYTSMLEYSGPVLWAKLQLVSQNRTVHPSTKCQIWIGGWWWLLNIQTHLEVEMGSSSSSSSGSSSSGWGPDPKWWLVTCYRTMENHPVQWINQRPKWPFSIAKLIVYQRVPSGNQQNCWSISLDDFPFW